MMPTERIQSALASMSADLGSGAANPVGLHRLLRDEASQGTRVPLLKWLDRWLRGPHPHLSHAERIHVKERFFEFHHFVNLNILINLSGKVVLFIIFFV